MNSHTSHPDSHTHGLADDCPRCAEHAESPLITLDNGNVARLIKQALDPDRFQLDRSDTDLVATAKVLTAMEQAGMLLACSPAEVTQYLRAKWRVPVFLLDENLESLSGIDAVTS